MADYAFEVLVQAPTLVEKGFGADVLPPLANSSEISIAGAFAVAIGRLNMTADPAASGGGAGSSIVQRTIPALARVSP